MRSSVYVHGYSSAEQKRLLDQARTLSDLLHQDTFYPPQSHVLEVGCGVGAQTIILAKNSPYANFISFDISILSLETARTAVAKQRLSNVRFCSADIFDLPFNPSCFDHIFVCFVLEHLRQPLQALERLRAIIKPGGSITVIEGDHASAFYHPASQFAQRAIDCLVEIQASSGGNALIGRQLYPLLREAGFEKIRVAPRQVYADSSRPEWVQGFTRETFTAMVSGAREQAIARGLIDVETWDRGIADLLSTAEEDGTFTYTFFKGVAIK